MQTLAAEPNLSVQKMISAPGRCPICGRDGAEELLRAPDRFHGRKQLYQLVRCPSCSLVWLENPPPPAEIGSHYGPDYDRLIAGVGDNPDHWRERRDVLQQYKAGGVVLDLGCSSGGLLAALKGPSWKLYGIEMSEDVARAAKENTGAEIFVGEILDAPFRPNSFDAITCFHVFEHLYQPREVLAKVAEWLKPGGVFYTFMPNIDSAGAHIFKSYWYALELPRHLYHFSPTSLSNVATSVGLEVVSLKTNHEVFIEYSARYWFDDLLERFGMPRVPLAKAKAPSLPWKIVRKMFRLTIRPILEGVASFAGDGESMRAVFRKAPLPDSRER
jgi:SAM-dependent methyltransferase